MVEIAQDDLAAVDVVVVVVVDTSLGIVAVVAAVVWDT